MLARKFCSFWWGKRNRQVQVWRVQRGLYQSSAPALAYVSWVNLFPTALVAMTGRGQQVAIFLLLLQSPIGAKLIHRCSSVIGWDWQQGFRECPNNWGVGGKCYLQYKSSQTGLSDNWLGPELKQLTKHLDRWGSLLAIETFTSFDNTCVLPNIWAEQSASTSLMSYGDGRQT